MKRKYPKFAPLVPVELAVARALAAEIRARGEVPEGPLGDLFSVLVALDNEIVRLSAVPS